MAKKETQTDDNKAMTRADQAGALTVPDFGEHEGEGFENFTKRDVAIPMLKLLQPQSPEVLAKGAKCKPGQFYNTVTGESSDEVMLVVGTTRNYFVEWESRDTAKGGGFRGTHSTDSEMVMKALADGEFGEYRAPSGNRLEDTFYQYGVQCDPETLMPVSAVTVAYWSSKIKYLKAWNARIKQFAIQGRKPPLFSHVVRLTSELKEFKEGSAFVILLSPWNGKLENSLIGQDDPRFQAALAVKQLMDSGEAKVDYGAAKEESAGSGEDIPF